MSKQKQMIATAVAAVLTGTAVSEGALVGQWVADDYTTGQAWPDRSGNNNTANQAGAAGATAPNATPNAFNGHKAVTFGGGTGTAAPGGFFTVPNNPPPGGVNGASALTLVAVFKPTAAGASSGGQFWQKSGLIGNEQGGAVADWGLSFGPQVVAAGVGGPDTTILSGDVALNTPHVAIQQWDSSGNLRLFVDGVQVAQQNTTVTAARNAVTFPAFALGANLSAINNDLKVFTGDVAEFRVYDDVNVDPVALTTTLVGTYVPEPGTAGLLAVGALGLLARRRRAVT